MPNLINLQTQGITHISFDKRKAIIIEPTIQIVEGTCIEIVKASHPYCRISH